MSVDHFQVGDRSKPYCARGFVAVALFAGLFLGSEIGLADENQCGGLGDDPIRATVNLHKNDEFHVVVDWAVTTNVKNGCPVARLNYHVSQGTEVYVWMRSAGNRAALERLRAERRLPLRHVWAYRSGMTWKVQETLKVTGDGMSDNQIDGLMLEASERGFFDWRTSSSKKRLKRGLWKVTIIDRSGVRIQCKYTESECEIEFNVK